jgi:hypothetical protein
VRTAATFMVKGCMLESGNCDADVQKVLVRWFRRFRFSVTQLVKRRNFPLCARFDTAAAIRKEKETQKT